tara:strand:- start:311 stop:826 length:516 start_codon:yes stop_codon:yes gene_type:complete
MKYFIFSDPHMGHEKMHLGGHRPKGYEDKIIKSIKNNVGIMDVIICLGDVSWYEHTKWHELITSCHEGKSILVKGNHDKKTDSWHYDKGWDMVCTSFTIKRLKKNILFTHKPQVKTELWDINFHGHLHDTGHRDLEFKDVLTESHVLIEMESNLNVRCLDSLIDAKIKEIG